MLTRQTTGNISLEELDQLPYLTVTQELYLLKDRIDLEMNPELMVVDTQRDILDINPDDHTETSTVNVEREQMNAIMDYVSNLIRARLRI